MDRNLTILRQLIMGFRNTQLLHVAAKLNIADALAAGPKTVSALAEETRAHPIALFRILRGLSVLGILVQNSDGDFTLTEMGQLLRSEVPQSMRNVAVLYGEQWLWSAYGNMAHSVLTGSPAFIAEHGCGLYEFLASNSEANAVFRHAMNAFSEREAAAILAAYDFSTVSMIVDIGAGGGALLRALLSAHPQCRGVAFDVPSAAAECEAQFSCAGLSSRTEFVGGDFFSSVPEGKELYILKSVLHNWEDDAAAAILRVCRDAVSPDGKVLIMERVITPDDTSAEAKLFDINMLVVAGGRERTEQEYRTLLEGAGFFVSRLLPTTSPLSIVEAIPVAR